MFCLKNITSIKRYNKHLVGFFMGENPSVLKLPIQENYEGRIDGHNLLCVGLNIHGCFVRYSSQEKSKR